jgi:hypothetical protein
MNQRRVIHFGFWSALVGSILGVFYIAVLVANFATQGMAYPPPEWVQLAGGIITLLTTLVLVVLMIAIYFFAPEDKKIYAALGVGFTILFAAVVSINRFWQLTVVRHNLAAGNTQELGRFMPYATDSVAFSLEMLGWGLFLSLAALSVAPVFSRDRLDRAIRWLFLVYGVLSLLSVIGYALESPLISVGFIAWGPVLSAITILLAILFSRARKTTARFS